jgi:hypothetical protein
MDITPSIDESLQMSKGPTGLSLKVKISQGNLKTIPEFKEPIY